MSRARLPLLFSFLLFSPVDAQVEEKPGPEDPYASRHEFGAGLPLTTSPADPVEVATSYARENFEALGVLEADVLADGLEISSAHTSEHNGVTHVLFQQKLEGISVFNASLKINVDREGYLLSVGSRLFPNAGGSFNTLDPVLSAQEALSRLGDLYEVPRGARTIETLEVEAGPSERTRLRFPELAEGIVYGELSFLPAAKGDLRLAWGLHLTLKGFSDTIVVLLDAPLSRSSISGSIRCSISRKRTR